MQQVQSLRLIAKSKSMSSCSSTVMGWGEGVIEDEDNFALPDPLALGSSLGLLFGTPPPGTNWLKSRFSLSRFFSFSRPLLLNDDDTGGVGTLIGSPAFRCLMHSSNKPFNWISDSFDLECSNLKKIHNLTLPFLFQRIKTYLSALINNGSSSTIAILSTLWGFHDSEQRKQECNQNASQMLSKFLLQLFFLLFTSHLSKFELVNFRPFRFFVFCKNTLNRISIYSTIFRKSRK